ncbi:MAG: glutaminyl-tRNA synthase (glutamine-hydrolyzing) subunit B [Candidatus Zambryskibacteria bacterium RIFCSPHIGHO2_02_FULL_43_14]|uniref:Aspartyl/glutamyl-tRNA(Asn/Gln) amidotransferase subunit B n=1 Tax=Candidatus Zambryskibacteria bacterium RIFCSPHIGHO2_02_FULL_43_14 TaxID=1802748 RepID=A0A1G2TFT9_9BACT|nr:MAG: glutaminyl-tRNA synthase (glutamine-hydrolyzing) subunit B [Candidatus Zambryskibacteria bacterium RIFCSPHIGHO2_01_FULL_43_60]OHA96175.1 MAG: glutaminyl-tRNA synthase (glutamine-hydrolyzing) subunit B [Candidatus Zambryskibacteria bacterium RIFCSPHIGHO2_02_FULL_43_14]OHB03826.1 MAG: glutaminyl-tRNA synthase (glutamine-hydrolyzing) subunit B [Candidatus Zambryskibacteria bacterium RIFCSPLOWO2_01_FULL_42_41]
MKDYTLIIGLEIHVELATKTKMFCNSKNDSNEKRPNANICPVCMGYPGTLPVINKEAVQSVLRLGLAVGGEIADFTEFDRKNYFYPDIPKGYQISQYKHPLVRGGSLLGVALTRIHLEEDTAKSIHTESGDSLLDFNRAGVPLVELVTEPVIHDSETAGRFAREFQLLLNYLGIAEANMEKGEMRVEANVSVSRSDLKSLDSKDGPFGTKVEVKNLNSFKAVEKAIKYEFDRQVGLLESGGEVQQETRGWNEEKEETFSQRVKEGSHDYRYFPDPDLPKLFIKDILDFAPEVLRRTIPELPWQKRERYKKDFGLKDEDIEIYVREPGWGMLFEETAQLLNDTELSKLASNYIMSDLRKIISAERMAEVIRMIDEGKISSRGAKDILKIIQEEDADPRTIAEEKDLIQISDREILERIVKEVMEENKNAPIQFLVGQAMKKSNSRANPEVLKNIFEELLK